MAERSRGNIALEWTLRTLFGLAGFAAVVGFYGVVVGDLGVPVDERGATAVVALLCALAAVGLWFAIGVVSGDAGE